MLEREFGKKENRFGVSHPNNFASELEWNFSCDVVACRIFLANFSSGKFLAEFFFVSDIRDYLYHTGEPTTCRTAEPLSSLGDKSRSVLEGHSFHLSMIALAALSFAACLSGQFVLACPT